MTFLWSFSYNALVGFHGKIFGSHNMTVLYPNLCYNEACYKEATLYLSIESMITFTGFIQKFKNTIP